MPLKIKNMKIEIIENDKIIDFQNVSLKDYRKELSDKMDLFSKIKLDFSSIQDLKGDKSILNMAFLQLKAEELNS